VRALSNENFGTVVTNLTYDTDTLTGFGKRNFNWEFSAGVQRELVPRVSADFTYFRRWYGNFVLVDDLAIGPADSISSPITAPRDPRLPGGGGYPVEGYDIKQAKFGVAAQPFVTLSRKYGKQQDYWDGVDATVNARPREGLFFQGGVSTGRRVEDNCDVVTKVDNPNPLYCHREEPMLTFVKATVLTRSRRLTCRSAGRTRPSRVPSCWRSIRRPTPRCRRASAAVWRAPRRPWMCTCSRRVPTPPRTAVQDKFTVNGSPG
jgi:hypothetical protein